MQLEGVLSPETRVLFSDVGVPAHPLNDLRETLSGRVSLAEGPDRRLRVEDAKLVRDQCAQGVGDLDEQPLTVQMGAFLLQTPVAH